LRAVTFRSATVDLLRACRSGFPATHQPAE
jgi:hypothetical protein